VHDAAERIKEKVKWGRLVSPVDNYLVVVIKRPHFTFSLIPSTLVALLLIVNQLKSMVVEASAISPTSLNNRASGYFKPVNTEISVMSNFVFVLDSNKRPIDPCHPAVARKLLKRKKAAIFRPYPFTIILSRTVESTTQQYELKLDPGSKTTGIALVKNYQVIWGAELTHRSSAIKSNLDSRRAIRRSRRNRKTRYRKPRFLNRTRLKGWLAPSLEHRVKTTITWAKRLIRFCPISFIAQELVRFDTQAIQNPEIQGVQYQQGTLLGYEVREYLLEKWQRKCTYCQKDSVPLLLEHIIPKAKGGTDRVSNLCLACSQCNQRKGIKDIEEFLKKKPLILQRIKAQLKTTLKDAAAVNSTRWKLFNNLRELGLPVRSGSGGLTKYNRTRLGLEKSHWLDAACVGNVENLVVKTKQPLLIKACGHGSRQMTSVNKYGFPRSKSKQKPFGGWKTGDIVLLITKKGEIYKERLLAANNPSAFEIRVNGKKIKANPKTNTLIKVFSKDGYSYRFSEV